jgi:hypothetical protein
MKKETFITLMVALLTPIFGKDKAENGIQLYLEWGGFEDRVNVNRFDAYELAVLLYLCSLPVGKDPFEDRVFGSAVSVIRDAVAIALAPKADKGTTRRRLNSLRIGQKHVKLSYVEEVPGLDEDGRPTTDRVAIPRVTEVYPLYSASDAIEITAEQIKSLDIH